MAFGVRGRLPVSAKVTSWNVILTKVTLHDQQSAICKPNSEPVNRLQRREQAARKTRLVAKLQRRAGEHGLSAQEMVGISHQLFQLGLANEALAPLRRAQRHHPDDVPLRAALAYALAATGLVNESIDQYRELLGREPDSAPLLTNLAVLLIKTGASDEARNLLERASQLAPQHANTAYMFAELLSARGQRGEAFHQYRRAAALFEQQIGPSPQLAHCDDLVKLASAEMWTGDLDKALATFDQAVALRPDHALALARRGLALAKLRRVPHAIDSLKRAAAAEPGFGEARRAIGELLLESGDAAAAQAHFNAAARINPADALARYFLAAAKKSEYPEAPPVGYVEKLFDEYARSFEQHLLGVLQYRAPELLCEALLRVAQPPPAKWFVIDLGCGTGLCGPLVRPLAARLVGVDLSNEMLEKARLKAIYDELLQGHLSDVLDRFAGTVDLAISADVFIYVGSLTSVFVAAARALKPGGWFAFTTEVHEGDGFILDTSGRYLHSRRYVESEAGASGLNVAHFEPIVARYEGNRPVIQNLYFLRRAA